MMNCHHGLCGKCHGFMKLLWGALLLVNAFLWPRWYGIDGWIAFIAVLMVLGGLLKILMPTCKHCVAAPMKMERPRVVARRKRR